MDVRARVFINIVLIQIDWNGMRQRNKMHIEMCAEQFVNPHIKYSMKTKHFEKKKKEP